MKRANFIVVSSTIFISGFLFCTPEKAFAHATPLSYEPEASSIVESAPSHVRIHFSEEVEEGVSVLSVFGPDGAKIAGETRVDQTDSHIMETSLSGAMRGTYRVSWQVVSADDGHFSKGSFVFSVGETSFVPALGENAISIIHSSGVPEASILALELIADALLLGICVLFAFIWRPFRERFMPDELSDAKKRFRHRLSVLFGLSALLGFFAGALYLYYKTSALASATGSTFALTFLPFAETVSGLFTIYRMALVLVIAILFFIFRKKIFESRKTTAVEWLLFILLAVVALLRARVSHAAASDFHPVFSVLMNFIHLYFKDVWIGTVLAILFLTPSLLKNLGNLKATGYLLTKLSQVLSIAFAIAGVTGSYVVWLHLKGFSNVLTTEWGKGFFTLSLFAGAFFLTWLFQTFIMERALVSKLLGHGDMPFVKKSSYFPLIFVSHAVFGVTILCLTASLIITTPPLGRHLSFEKHAEANGIVVRLEEYPYENVQFLLTSQDAKTGAEADGDVSATLSNKEGGTPPIELSLSKIFPGGYIFPVNALTSSGEWTLSVHEVGTNSNEASAELTFNYPKEIEESDVHAGERVFGAFELACIFAALFILVFAIYLYRRSKRFNLLIVTSSPTEEGSKAPLLLSERGLWLTPLILVLGVITSGSGVHGVHGGIFVTPFERQCEKDSLYNIWQESVSIRAGVSVSDASVPGCTVGFGQGQYHFADSREYAYFTREAKAKAELEITPETIRPHATTTLLFKIRDAAGEPVEDLILDHDRILHVIIVNDDFTVFSHIHPEDQTPLTEEMLESGEFSLEHSFPKDGRYMISADYMERAWRFADQFYVNVGSTTLREPPGLDFARVKDFDGYHVTLGAPKAIKAGESLSLLYHIERGGLPVTTLTPYLTVPMHLSFMRDDLSQFGHYHGLLPVSTFDKLFGLGIHASHLYLPAQFGPDIEVPNVIFNAPGNYFVFGEFSDNGKIVVTKFNLKVE